MPDRSITLTLRYTFPVVVDEGTLRRRLNLTDEQGRPRDPTASEMSAAFASWKAETIANAKKNFITGNALAADAKIEVQVT